MIILVAQLIDTV